MPGDQLGRALLASARHAIATELAMRVDDPPAHAALLLPGATFVTLFCRGELRGCIGSLKATRELGFDVRENALAAAFRDPRFAPLTATEFESTSVEVSLLSTAESLRFDTEGELLARLRPGIDGVTLELADRRATFLPQVWETLPEAGDFLAALKHKAGFPVDFWSPWLNVALYQVTKWQEHDCDYERRAPEVPRTERRRSRISGKGTGR
jgi:AmmeMemoRadiSam system protein A